MAGTDPGSGSRPLSLDELYEIGRAPILARCMALLGNSADAEDATQEVFRRAAEHLDHIHTPLHWMLRVASNVCYEEQRRRRRESSLLDRERVLLHATPGLDTDADVCDWSALRRLLQRLSPSERAVLGHRWMWGATFEETAGDLSIASSTARNLMLRVRRKIGDEVQRHLSGVGSALVMPLADVRMLARDVRSWWMAVQRTPALQRRALGLALLGSLAIPAALCLPGVGRPPHAQAPPPPRALHMPARGAAIVVEVGARSSRGVRLLTLNAVPSSGARVAVNGGAAARTASRSGPDNKTPVYTGLNFDAGLHKMPTRQVAVIPAGASKVAGSEGVSVPYNVTVGVPVSPVTTRVLD
jgi:RNA polymerase sigma-70 factor (ECF subfamily)